MQEKLTLLKKERLALQKKSIEINNEFKFLKQSAEAKIQIKDLLKIKHSLTREQLDIVIAVKNAFDKNIKNLADNELADDDIAFKPSETGLPSRALDKARRETYVSQFFEGDEWAQKISGKGITAILISIGVLNK